VQVVLRQMSDFVRVNLRTFALVENKRRLGAQFSLVLSEQVLSLNSLGILPENVGAVPRVLHHQKLDLGQRVERVAVCQLWLLRLLLWQLGGNNQVLQLRLLFAFNQVLMRVV
jgi:hypothetical protein